MKYHLCVFSLPRLSPESKGLSVLDQTLLLILNSLGEVGLELKKGYGH